MLFPRRGSPNNQTQPSNGPAGAAGSGNNSRAAEIGGNLDANISKIRAELGSDDLIINLSQSNPDKHMRFACVYIDNLISDQILSDYSVELSELLESRQSINAQPPSDFFNILKSRFSGVRRVSQGSNLNDLVNCLLSGEIIFLVDGHNVFLSVDAFSPECRQIEESTTQSTVRGPKESFTEKIGTNVAMIRKRIRDKELKAESLIVGSRSRTKIILMFINNLAKKEILDEIRRRLNSIQIDGILDSGYIEELIKDNRYSIFPTLLNTEKPDTASACLLEGKVVILVDGTPFALIAPALFSDFFQSSEDYYHQFHISTLTRLIRYLAFLLAIFVPALYITLASYHQEMIPTPLLISILAQREGVPFPTSVEVLLMEVTFEILREAGIRMPRVIGPAISIVGALVLGQAAVEAGIISAVIVIIVSTTAIASFTIPNYSMANAARVIRFIMILIASIFGLVGIFWGTIALMLELCRLKSIGIPYMSPLAPKAKSAAKDTLLRYPIWKSSRPEGISTDPSQRASSKEIVTEAQKQQPEFR